MRAEVGLLTRNIKFQGDTSYQEKKLQEDLILKDKEYGAHIMLHSEGDESSEGRFEFVELKHVGQAN